MSRILSAVLVAVSVGSAAPHVLAQAQPAPSQQREADPQLITFNGCVYTVPTDPAIFAFERTPDADSTGTQPSSAKPAEQANVRGAQGLLGTTTMSPGGAAGTGTAGSAPATSYARLSTEMARDFGDFVGKPVRIQGKVTPATKGSEGASAANLSTAPQLVVHDIKTVEGQCRTSSAAPAAAAPAR